MLLDVSSFRTSMEKKPVFIDTIFKVLGIYDFAWVSFEDISASRFSHIMLPFHIPGPLDNRSFSKAHMAFFILSNIKRVIYWPTA